MTLRITNRQARHLWLWTNGLLQPGTGRPDVMEIIRALGFVQIDTIRNVTRAHHHILWSRNPNYRERMLWQLLQGRDLFEHFTHDASLIPMAYLPYWQRQFARLGAKVAKSDWYKSGLAQAEIENIRTRITTEGALSTHAFDTKCDRSEMWARPPHKKALDQMWYAGELATSHRKNFVKFYDLGSRVFAPHDPVADQAQIDQLCQMALDRLSVATCGEIQRFWDAVTNAEAKTWLAAQTPIEVQIECADGTWRDSYAAHDINERLAKLSKPTSRIQLLNPFDPAIRDRARAKRLFGFDYVNEMFVPKAKRRWGYYVYPLLEGDRFVGRIELTADRTKAQMQVKGFWSEAGVKWGMDRCHRLDSELKRFGRLAGIREIMWHVPHPADQNPQRVSASVQAG